MDDQGQDAFYMVVLCDDSLVLARQVSPDALMVPEVGQSLISYLGEDARSQEKAASGALSVLVAREKADAATAGPTPSRFARSACRRNGNGPAAAHLRPSSRPPSSAAAAHV